MADIPHLDQFDALMRARHSCRGFLADPVPDAQIAEIVATAQKSPSWCNAQPWQAIITRGAATEAFRDVMLDAFETGSASSDIPFPAAYEGRYQTRRRVCGFQLYEAVGVERGDRPAYARQMRENYRFFGAPHVAVITGDRTLGEYGILDCGGFVTAFLLAAEAAGVATIPQAAIAGYSDIVRAHFDLPDDRIVVCAISFGYRDRDHPANSFRTERASLDEVIDWR